MLRTVLSIACCLFVLVGSAFGTDSKEPNYCERLDEMKLMAFKPDVPVDDEIYNGLIGQGQEAVECLLERVMNTHPMPDPRQAPPYGGFTVGDAALFLLLEICRISSIEQFLPEPYRSQWENQGIYAYFAYVSEGVANRQQLADALKASECH